MSGSMASAMRGDWPRAQSPRVVPLDKHGNAVPPPPPLGCLDAVQWRERPKVEPILYQVMGGCNLQEYYQTFGRMAWFVPAESTYTRFEKPPAYEQVLYMYGETVYAGLTQCRESFQHRRRGWSAWSYYAYQPQPGIVWVPSWTFSYDGLQQPTATGEPGRWYPALIVMTPDGYIFFECPKIGVVGSRIWIAHASRVWVWTSNPSGAAAQTEDTDTETDDTSDSDDTSEIDDPSGSAALTEETETDDTSDSVS